MSRLNGLLLVVVPLQLSFATSAFAVPMTFDVDLSATPQVGHTLRLFGSLTVDPDLPVGSAIVTSALFLEHDNTDIVLLPAIPTYNGPVATNLDWEVSGLSLYITRTGPISAWYEWEEELFFASSPDNLFRARFGSGPNAHELSHALSDSSDVDLTPLAPPTGPDGPLGFFFGTLAATPVPEPSICLLALQGVMLFAARSRRRSGHR